MTYDWTAPADPPCDWCGETVDELTRHIDREDFWGHLECYPVAMADPDMIRALRETVI